MFALVLHDAREQRVVAARDAPGQKPLYIRRTGAGLFIASTMAALRVPLIGSVEVDEQTLAFYLWTLMPPGNATLAAGIELLPAGSFSVFDHAGAIVTSGRFSDAGRKQPEIDDLSEAAAEFRSLLDAAVHEQSVDASCAAAHLSGGLDSSAIVEALRRAAPSPIKTYSCSYKVTPSDVLEEERGFEEAYYGRIVADHLGVANEVVKVDPQDYLTHLVDLVATIDEPRGNPCLPHYRLAQRIGRSHRIVFSGEGADELFGGYAWKLKHARTVDGAQRFWQAIVPAPVALLESSLDGRWSNADIPRQYVVDAVDARSWEERLVRILRFDQEHFLRYLLLQADKLCGRFSLEGRYPFLDARIRDFASRLVPRLRQGGLWDSKPIMREALKGLIPPAVLARPKVGFVAPEGGWYRHVLQPMLRSVLLDPNAFVRSLYKTSCLNQIVADHFRGHANYRKLIWSLLTLEIWHRTVICGAGRETVSSSPSMRTLAGAA